MGGSSSKSSGGTGIVLDFDAQPTEKEKAIHKKVSTVTEAGSEVIDILDNYKGCDAAIKKAIEKPGKAEDQVWDALVPNVESLHKCWKYSEDIKKNFPKLLEALCKDNDIQNQPSLIRQFGKFVEFVLTWDEYKMNKPSLQNDFAYYRRTVNARKKKKSSTKVPIKDEVANQMSLFFASPTPMMTTLRSCAVDFMKDDAGLNDAVCKGLSFLVKICADMISKGKTTGENTVLTAKIMAGCIILFDHLSPGTTGSFSKKSPINIRLCVKVIRNSGIPNPQNLLNAVRFTSKNFNSPSTPTAFKALFD